MKQLKINKELKTLRVGVKRDTPYIECALKLPYDLTLTGCTTLTYNVKLMFSLEIIKCFMTVIII